MGFASSSSSSIIKWHLFFFWVVFTFSPNEVALADSDKAVLLELKNSVSDPSGLLSSWNSGDSDHCSSWFGVACDSNSRVVALNMTGNGKGGISSSNSNAFSCSIYAQFPLYGFGIRRNCVGGNGQLFGKVNPLIAKLSELRVLSLPFNGFHGEIPSEIWEMEKLEVLDLEGNLLSGLLPVSFSGLRNLRVLNLGFNSIGGMIPNSLSNCQKLEVLNLSGNRVNGTLPGFIGRLKGVYLMYNWIGGYVPSEIGANCGKLEHLDLSGNSLIGPIPCSLGNCSNLRSLLLYSNMLEEVIPAELGRLQKLEVLDLSWNSLSGLVPAELGNLSELSVLVLSNLFDPLPETNEIKGDPSLEQLNEDFNYYQGPLPVEITSLPKLRILWAPRAMFGSGLPSSWGACDNLEMVNLAQNFFTGEIPKELNRCKKLHFLNLSSNRLSGELVEGLPVPCMTVFDVSGNTLSGSIPRFDSNPCSPISSLNEYTFESFDGPSAYLSFLAHKAQVKGPLSLLAADGGLAVLHNFGANNFTGVFLPMPISPERLGQETTYAFLAGENKLTGPFPGDLLDKCDGLGAVIVNVSYNRISGRIPDNIGSMCRSLKLLDAYGNQIVGTIPPSVGELVSLAALNLSRNLLQGQIPAGLGQIKALKFLSLASNNLTGLIPSGLGQLQSLQVLELSSNSLSGEIPRDLVNLRSLTVLLLTNNNLSGQIPTGFSNVTTLSVFNVSFNNLSGSLPSNDSLLKCSCALGNPYIQPCNLLNVMIPSPDPPGMIGGSQNYAATPFGSPIQRSSGNSGFNSIEIASITSASAIVSVLIALIFLFIYTRKINRKSTGSARKEVTIFTDIGVPLTYENVVQATGSFNASNCIGNGGFGATYKAEISPGVLVAIKRLSVGRFQGFQQFDAEIRTLGRLRHPNLVTLVGYHASETEMFLVYNYLPGGNLEKFIQERSIRAADWKTLHKIALDIARALAYLHDQCVPRVLHRDVKPSNILLDDDFNAYLSDFGLARLLGTSETHATTGVAGTFGYVAPEYAMTCRVSDKADVYSYGVVLLELLSDKKALDPSFSSYGNGFNIVAWACMLLRQGRAKEFFAAGLWDAGPHDDLVEVLHLAVVCTVDSLSTRPTMRQVVRRLKQLQPPSC